MQRHRTFRSWRLAVAVGLAGFAAGPSAREGDLPYHRLAEDAMTCGGGSASTSRFRVRDVLGESFAPGESFSDDFTEGSGFVETLTASLASPLDINVDGAVGAEDTFIFATAWYRLRGQPEYRERADADGDLIVDRDDLCRYLKLVGESR